MAINLPAIRSARGIPVSSLLTVSQTTTFHNEVVMGGDFVRLEGGQYEGIWANTPFRINKNADFSVKFKMRRNSWNTAELGFVTGGLWFACDAILDNSDDVGITNYGSNIRIVHNVGFGGNDWIPTSLNIDEQVVYDFEMANISGVMYYWLLDGNRDRAQLLASYPYRHLADPFLAFISSKDGMSAPPTYYNEDADDNLPCTILAYPSVDFGDIVFTGEQSTGMPVLGIAGGGQLGTDGTLYVYDSPNFWTLNNVCSCYGPEQGDGYPKDGSQHFYQQGGGYTGGIGTGFTGYIRQPWGGVAGKDTHPTFSAGTWTALSCLVQNTKSVAIIGSVRGNGGTPGTLKCWLQDSTGTTIVGLSQTGGTSNGDSSFTPVYGSEMVIQIPTQYQNAGVKLYVEGYSPVIAQDLDGYSGASVNTGPPILNSVSFAPYIFATTIQQSGKANIISKNVVAVSGKTRVTAKSVITQPGKASIKAVSIKTMFGRSWITSSSHPQKYQAGLSRITSVKQSVSLGRARITVKATKTQAGKASIVQSSSSTQQLATGKAYLNLPTSINVNWDLVSDGIGLGIGWTSLIYPMKVVNHQVLGTNISYPSGAFYSGRNWAANHYAKAKVINNSGVAVNVCCRPDYAYYYQFYVTSTNIYLRDMNGPYVNAIPASATYTVNANSYIECRYIDGTIAGYVDDQLVLGPIVITARTGAPGIGAGGTVGILDDWTGGNLPVNRTMLGKSNITEYIPYLKVKDNFTVYTNTNWTTVTGLNPIQMGNGIAQAISDSGSYYTGVTFNKAQYAQVTISEISATSTVSLLLRASGNTYYQMKMYPTSFYIYRVTNGGFVNFANTYSTVAITAGQTWKFAIDKNNNLSVWLNGNIFVNWPSDPAPITSNGSPGLRLISTAKATNFEAGNYGPIKQQDITGKANIAFLATRDLYGKSKVIRVEQEAQTGISSIIKVLKINQVGMSRIKTLSRFTISGNSNIKTLNTKNLTGISNIIKTYNKQQLGKSVIKKTITNTINGKSFILVDYLAQKPVLGKASILKSAVRDIKAVSRITIKSQKTITGKSTLTKINQVIQHGTSNILKNRENVQFGISQIITRSIKDICGKANIVGIVPIISFFKDLPVELCITSNITDKDQVRILGKYALTTFEVTDNKNGAIRINTTNGIKSVKHK